MSLYSIQFTFLNRLFGKITDNVAHDDVVIDDTLYSGCAVGRRQKKTLDAWQSSDSYDSCSCI